MVGLPSPVFAQPAAAPVGVAVVILIWYLMVVLPPPVLTDPAAGLVEVGAEGQV